MSTPYTFRSPLRVLLTDGSGLTARQVATQAAVSGHHVEALTSSGTSLAGFTRHVRATHRVPPFGQDATAWYEATLHVLASGAFDVLLPTQENVTLLARDPDRVTAAGVGVVVPPFASLLRVQDKAAQARTLAQVGLPHPRTEAAGSRAEILDCAAPPFYLKSPVGTASLGVRHVRDLAGLDQALGQLDTRRGLLVQEVVRGPLVMIQSVFDRGRLLAVHGCVRRREGPRGGAVAKESVDVAAEREQVRALGSALDWHGALSLDVIRGPAGPVCIDINPRLVEPGNAWRSGLDLVALLLDMSTGTSVAQPATPRAGVRTHQLLLGLLDAADRGRVSVLRELRDAMAHAGTYRGSREELTPVRRDLRTVVPLAATAAELLLRPSRAGAISGRAVRDYALTGAAWDEVSAQVG